MFVQCVMHGWRHPLHRSSHQGRSPLLSPGVTPDISYPSFDVATKTWARDVGAALYRPSKPLFSLQSVRV